jgi:hypothetical protein
MKLCTIRSVSALGLAVFLAACGGGQADQPAQTAMAVQSDSGAQANVGVGTTAGVPAGAPPGTTAGTSATTQVAVNMPLPDCAADGCKSLRIIDGNAEAYRYEAMRRAAAEGSATNT